ncbi:MAG: nucleotidyltransferase domain-containing protein [Chloroflexi bacterium]|nr:nucleotidyltransferase domain-containing protein [Chloroflexota bacterium]
MPAPFATLRTPPEPTQRQERRPHRRRETQRPLTGDDKTGRDDIPPVIPTGSNRPVSETLPPAIQRIVQTLDPERIVLFGSYAYGAPTPDSDVDLLVVMHTNASPRERHLAVARLLRPRLFPVDVIVRTPDEIRRSLRQRDFFLQEIFERGKVLYERPQ